LTKVVTRNSFNYKSLAGAQRSSPPFGKSNPEVQQIQVFTEGAEPDTGTRRNI